GLGLARSAGQLMDGWFEGNHGIPRTGQSSLTDDELLICDFIFRSWTSLSLLYADDLHEAFNLEYSHSFNRLEMDAIMKALIDGGIIASEKRRGGPFAPFVSLTDKGGALWEKERMPVWDAYCAEGY